jgi:hypothetical protein
MAAIIGPLVLWSAWLGWMKFRIADTVVVFIFTIAFVTGIAWLATLTQVVDISDWGLVLYRVNRVPWAEVVTAERSRVLGLNYLKLGLQSGRVWWLPLFFRGDGAMVAALQRFAPDGHPVKSCLASRTAG